VRGGATGARRRLHSGGPQAARVSLRRLVGGAARKSYSPPGGRRTQWGDRACSAPTLFPKDQKGCKTKPLAL
jgi:hypothetical protein